MNTLENDRLPLRELVSNCVRFWEPSRILYNIALAAVVVTQLVVHRTTNTFALGWPALRIFFNLAVVANVLYCAAYLPDVLMQNSGFREVWLRYRWVLLSIGILFGCSLAWDISQGIIVHVVD